MRRLQTLVSLSRALSAQCVQFYLFLVRKSRAMCGTTSVVYESSGKPFYMTFGGIVKRVLIANCARFGTRVSKSCVLRKLRTLRTFRDALRVSGKLRYCMLRELRTNLQCFKVAEHLLQPRRPQLPPVAAQPAGCWCGCGRRGWWTFCRINGGGGGAEFRH